MSTDIIGQLNYYEISDDSKINKMETKEIYSTSDLDNLISLFSLDILSNSSSPEIIIGSSKGEVVHLKNNEISHKYTNNKSTEYSKVRFINNNLFSSGDSKGNLTLFDIRQQNPIKIFSEQSEEITDIIYVINKHNFLLSSSIDSTLCVYDLRKNSLYALSDSLDEELNCLLTIKGGNHILCGSGEGNILIFNWNWFGDFKDQITGHPEGINCMDKFNDNIIFTGCEDGGVRICSIYPKGLRGVLSSENNKKKSDLKEVNKIKINTDKKNIITCLGMDCLRLYNISNIDFAQIYKSNEFNFDDNDNDNDIDNEENENNINNIIKNKKEGEGEDEDKDEDEDEDKESDEEIKDDEEDEELDDDIDDEEEDEEGEEEEEEEEEGEEGEEKEEKYEFKNNDKEKKILNKKRKKEKSEDNSDSDGDKKEEEENSDESESSSSFEKKRKTKKVKKLDKNKKTKSLIDKEERKLFFNDL